MLGDFLFYFILLLWLHNELVETSYQFNLCKEIMFSLVNNFECNILDYLLETFYFMTWNFSGLL